MYALTEIKLRYAKDNENEIHPRSKEALSWMKR
jgi:hypothetical protein